MSDTMVICMFRQFLQHVDDASIRALMEKCVQLSEKHIRTVTDLFTEAKFPIPIGFSDEDVNMDAPRLYTDTFYLHYLDGMAKFGMVTYTAAVAAASRKDIREFYSGCLSESDALVHECEDILDAKGLMARPPVISTPEKVNYIKKQSFLTGFLGNRRTLNAIEITNLHMNFLRLALSKAAMIGFAQVAQTAKVRQHMERGMEIQTKHLKVFTDILMEDNLPAPTTLDAEVTNSTTWTFSDKLMMHHLASLTATAIGNYGLAIGACLRRDLALTYSRFMSEAALYHEDGANLSIAHGWLEEPPQADDRKHLARQH